MVEASLACKGKRFKRLMAKTHVKTKIFASKSKPVCATTKPNKVVDVTVKKAAIASCKSQNDAMLRQKHRVVENPAG